MKNLNVNRKSKIKKWQLNLKDHTVICKTLERNEVSLARLLVKRGYRINPPTLQATTTPLHLAIKMGQTKLVKQLLRRDASLEVKDDRQMTALHVALECQEEDIPKLVLLKAFQKLKENFSTIQLMTELHAACLIKDIPLIKKYLRKLLDVNLAISPDCPLYPRYTALHIAVMYNNESMVRLLLRYGADVCVTNGDGLTPIHLADHHSPDEIVHALLDIHVILSKFDVNPTAPSGVSHLHMACKYGHKASIKGFVKNHKQDLNIVINSSKWSTYPTALHCIIPRMDTFVRMFLANNADISLVNCLGQSALHVAFWKKRLMIVDSLLQYNACYFPHVNPHDCRGVSHLHIACTRTTGPHVVALLRAGADINQSSYELAHPAYRHLHPGYTPLQAAIKYGRHIILQMLLRNGADINGTNGIGNTPLMTAAAVGNQVALVLLLRAGAKVNEQNIKTDTALLIAVKNRSTQFADLLIEKGALVNHYDKTRKTAMYWACQYGKMRDMHALLQAGCNMNVKDARGRTLMHAAMGTQMDGGTNAAKLANYTCLVKLLLDAGLDLNGRDCAGNTPLHVAVKRGNPYAIMVLLEYGADMELYNGNGLIPIQMYTTEKSVQNVDIIVHCFAFHITKLRLSKQRCIPTTMDPVWREIKDYIDFTMMRKVNERFELEFDLMRNCHLDRYTTLYDVAFISAIEMVVHLNNKKLSMVINSVNFRYEYPLFNRLVKETYQKAWKKAKLVRRAKIAISFLHERRLSLPCCEAILRHLDDKDMIAVMKAVKVP